MQPFGNRIINGAQTAAFSRPFCKIYAENNQKISEEFNDEAQESTEVPPLKAVVTRPKLIGAPSKAILVPLGTFVVQQTQPKRAVATECDGDECQNQNCNRGHIFSGGINGRKTVEEEVKESAEQQQEEEEDERRKSWEEDGEEEEEEAANGKRQRGKTVTDMDRPCGDNGGSKQYPRRCCCCCCECANKCDRCGSESRKTIIGGTAKAIDHNQSVPKKVPLRLFKPFFAKNANFRVFNSPPKLFHFGNKMAEKQRTSVDESLENLKERLGKISSKLDFWKTNFLHKPEDEIGENTSSAADHQQQSSRADQLKMLKEVINKELSAITVTENLTKTFLENGGDNAADGDDGSGDELNKTTAQPVMGMSSSNRTTTNSASTSAIPKATPPTTTTTATTSSSSTLATKQQTETKAGTSSPDTILSTLPTTEMPLLSVQNSEKNVSIEEQQQQQELVTSVSQSTQTMPIIDSNITSPLSTTTVKQSAHPLPSTTAASKLQTMPAELPTPPPYVPSTVEQAEMPMIVHAMMPAGNANNGTKPMAFLVSNANDNLTKVDQQYTQNGIGIQKINTFALPSTVPSVIVTTTTISPLLISVSPNKTARAVINEYTVQLPAVMATEDQNLTKMPKILEEEKGNNGTKELLVNKMQFDENNLEQNYNANMEDPQIAANGRLISLVTSNFMSKKLKESEHKKLDFKKHTSRESVYDISK